MATFFLKPYEIIIGRPSHALNPGDSYQLLSNNGSTTTSYRVMINAIAFIYIAKLEETSVRKHSSFFSIFLQELEWMVLNLIGKTQISL